MTRFDITQIKNPELRAQALRLAEAAKSQQGTRIPQPGEPISSSLTKDRHSSLVAVTGSVVPRAPQPNKTEAEFNRLYLGGAGQFEAITFRLAGGSRYTPDWYVFFRGLHIVIEIKGAYRHHSYGRALTAWREARAQFPGFTFCWAARGADRSWTVEGLPCLEGAGGIGTTIAPHPPSGAEAGYFSRMSVLRKGSDGQET